MTEEEIFESVKAGSELSSLPQVLAEVIRVAGREDSSAKELENVISKDPALTARLLRMANSPFYGTLRTVSSIKQAVVNMGSRAVLALALSTSLYGIFESSPGVVDRIHFWRHSLETAIASREIAALCGYQPVEEAFVAGLVHDLGLLVLESVSPVTFKKMWQQVNSCNDLLRLEREMLGATHARVGWVLMEQWQLPPVIVAAVGHHHGASAAGPAIPKHPLGRIVALANMISKFRVYQRKSLEVEEVEKIESLSESLNIDAPTLAVIQEHTLDVLIKESQFLEIKIGSVKELLEDANQLIFKQYLLVEEILRDNRKMQEEIARIESRKAALESLKTLTATLSHYINNASSTIMSRAQMVQRAIEKGDVADHGDVAGQSMGLILQSVQTISMVLDELKKLSHLDTTQYIDETEMLNIEDRLKKKMLFQ
jgi:HD-like signal output (HDOD) protein